MKFAVFTHVEHFERQGKYFAYAPYVREMNLWLRHVEEVCIVAPMRKAYEENTDLAYFHDRIAFQKIPSVDFLSIRRIARSIFKLPQIIFKICKAMAGADHIHLRCPGNIGLLACICQIFFPKKAKTAKYAGNWDPNAKQPWSYDLQKWILSNTFLTRNMQVLVYGEWPGQTKNVRPFFTASFAERERRKVTEKNFEGPLTFLFVGNLVEGKRPLEAMRLLSTLKKRSAEKPVTSSDGSTGSSMEDALKLMIYGDGPERNRLEKYLKKKNLEDVVKLKGNKSLDELKEAYQKAHFVILPSRSEGWPKALAEGMFFGCIPIATPVSCVPWMLGHGSRGILLEKLKQRPTANGQQPTANNQQPEKRGESKEERKKKPSDEEKILTLIADPKEMKKISEAAEAWSQQYTLENFEAAIKDVLVQSRSTTTSFSNRNRGKK